MIFHDIWHSGRSSFCSISRGTCESGFTEHFTPFLQWGDEDRNNNDLLSYTTWICIKYKVIFLFSLYINHHFAIILYFPGALSKSKIRLKTLDF